MKRSIAVFLLFVATGFANAKPDRLTGEFTHDFTKPANESVWTVTKSGAGWRVFVHGSNKILSAMEASPSERQDFWEQMWWPAEKASGAQCIRFDGEWPGMMCYAPADLRAGISDLAKKKVIIFTSIPWVG